MPFLAKLLEQATEFLRRQVPDQVGGRGAAARIHPHVQGLIALKTETSAAGFQMVQRKAEIRQDAVEAFNTEFGKGFGQLDEVARQEVRLPLPGGKHLPGVGDGIRIPIQADKRASGRNPFQQQAGVPRTAQGAIGHDLPRGRGQGRHHLCRHGRWVVVCHGL
jgi:hypothetical protein